jgi:hypothetical protein
VQEILIDGGQFVLQRLIEEIQNFRFALHGSPLGERRMVCAQSGRVSDSGELYARNPPERINPRPRGKSSLNGEFPS